MEKRKSKPQITVGSEWGSRRENWEFEDAGGAYGACRLAHGGDYLWALSFSFDLLTQPDPRAEQGFSGPFILRGQTPSSCTPAKIMIKQHAKIESRRDLPRTSDHRLLRLADLFIVQVSIL